ncbi:MAG: triose-phosphate isomerase [Betaproteobacteria bacterium]|nr:triose-phosphate isomerase [Betaproteobacteria bacterium]
MRDKLVVGNWKMNGGLAANAKLLARLASEWTHRERRKLVVCVPAPYLGQAQAALSSGAVMWGVQDVSEHASGAYTGEVAAGMAAEFGCRYAIVGHSERRRLHGETDRVVGAKAAAALAGGLVPVACVGETLDERERGATEEVVARQVDAVIEALGAAMCRCVVAYEPVWAIGTGRTASPEQAQAVHALLRSRLAAAGAGDVSVLYGGSVKGSNAAALFAMPDIDGALVGGASLDADEFLTIARA